MRQAQPAQAKTAISEARRIWWRGALSLPALGIGAAGISAHLWPDWPLLGPLARMLESAAPQLLGLSLICAAALAWLGAPRLGAGLGLAALLGGALLGLQHRASSAALMPDAPPGLHILWFNMLHENTTPPAQLIAALAASEADLVVLTEAAPLVPHRAALEAHFDQVIGCDRPNWCNLLVLQRAPHSSVALQPLDGSDRDRLGVITLQLPRPGAAPAQVTLLAVHLVKPWFYGIREHDMWHVLQALSQARGPLAMVGDFNAAPWSARLRSLNARCGLQPPRRPPASWPAAARGWGIPIDLALTRDGAVLRALRPWGEGLGSNHRGLMLELSLGDLPAAAPPRPDCVPEQRRG